MALVRLARVWSATAVRGVHTEAAGPHRASALRRYRKAKHASATHVQLEGLGMVRAALDAGWKPLAILTSSRRWLHELDELTEGRMEGGQRAGLVPSVDEFLRLNGRVEPVVAVFEPAQPLQPRPAGAAHWVRNETRPFKGLVYFCQDPTNAGSLIRTAVAFGFDAVYRGNGGVSPHNLLSIRSSANAVFEATFGLDEQHVLKTLPKFYLEADPLVGQPVPAELPDRFLLVVGHETRGVPKHGQHGFLGNGVRVCIPLPGGAKMASLNAGVAGAIGMHAFLTATTTS